MVNAKRAKSIPPVYRNRFNVLVIFKTLLPEDIEYLSKWAGLPPEQARIFEHDVSRLEQGEHIIINLDNHTYEKMRPI